MHEIHSMCYMFAVVAQAYKVDVEVTGGASRGCTAILRCIIPSYVKDLVRVVSWLHEPSSYIYPSLQGGKCTRVRALGRPIREAKNSETPWRGGGESHVANP